MGEHFMNENERFDFVKIYNKAIQWVMKNTVPDKGIVCNSDLKKSYPEVSGYFIPTLLRWGYRDLAVQYAKWLCNIQKPDGSWYDTNDGMPYVFDTAQILKGLLAIRKIYPEVDDNIQKGCDWILSNIQPSGRLTTPDTAEWGDGRACSELIHLYCLSPLIEAAEVFDRVIYREEAIRVFDYYKSNHYEDIMNFRLLSHFYAYVMEALIDLGEVDMARKAMKQIAEIQQEDGRVPGYYDVNWVCSTGLFQFALVWFRLGDTEHGDKAFKYACGIQNESGGWYGSYPTLESTKENNDYFPESEISWAVKYFLDALYYKNDVEFELEADTFLETIDKSDGRYRAILGLMTGAHKKVLDVGCGKGRYLKNLLEDRFEHIYFAVDISERVMCNIEESKVEKRKGSLTQIPYEDNCFDVVYTCEALEHSVDIRSAIREMARVTKPGGRIAIIDKNIEMAGILEIGECEQWFDVEELKKIMMLYCTNVQVENAVPYENKNDRLFSFWTGIVR